MNIAKIKDPERVRNKQQQIYRGAMKIFRTKGFHSASIREIAKASRISLGSLYDYIEKKEDILFLVHREILRQIYEGMQESMERYENPVDQLTHSLREMYRLTFRLKEEILFIYTETKNLDKPYLRETLNQEAEFVLSFEEMIKRGIKEDLFKCPNPRFIANLIPYLGGFFPLRGWNFGPQYSEDDMVEQLVDIVLHTLNAKPGDRAPEA